jgi:protease-4
MKKFLLGILVGFLLFGLAATIAAFAMMRAATRPPGIPGRGVLVLAVEGDIPERPPVQIPFLGGPPTPTVRDYWELLKKAAADPRIRAIVLMPRDVGAGWAKLEEIRSGLETFRRSGKPLYAWLQAPRTRDYYLATAAERIYMPREDVLDMKGLRFELMYLKEGLDKLGVEVEIAHAGKYKDAPEMFTRSGPSDPSREMMNSLLDELYSQLLATIARARRKSPEQVRAILDEGPFLAPHAQAAGLVDALKYQDEVFAELRTKLGGGNLPRVRYTDYVRVPPGDAGLRVRHRVALVAAEGSIVREAGDALLGGEAFLSAREMRQLLRQVGEDRDIRGVIVRVDSPGGDSFASDEIWREMQLVSRKKPLVISMSDTAASGGYYIAMTGDPVLAYPGTVTGSIGVFYGKANLRGLYHKLGIRKEILSRGRMAEIDSDYTPLSPAGRAKLEQIVDETYDSFLDRVEDGRKLPRARVEELAQGRVWLGSQARQNGLVSELGGLDRAVDLVRRKAGIAEADAVRLVSYPPRRSIIEVLLERPREPVAGLLAPLGSVSTVQWLRGGMFYLVPFTLEIR